MRIVTGIWRGRRLVAPTGTATRPTSDRVREALFSSLEAIGAVTGSRVLDAFAGTGALGLEALSRGASDVVFVEKDRAALSTLQANITSLGAERSSQVITADVLALVARKGLPAGPFSLLFLDPPYKLDQSKVRVLIESLVRQGGLSDGALVVWEHATGSLPDWPDGFVRVRVARYGDTTVSVARFEEAGEVR